MLYHGTTSNYLPQILKRGLRPFPSHTWHISEMKYDDGKHVYLTPDKNLAAQFAVEKANFLRSPRGYYFPVEFNGHEVWWKTAKTPVVPDAEPIILEVDLPPTCALLPDPEALFIQATMTDCIIPPSRLKAIPLE